MRNQTSNPKESSSLSQFRQWRKKTRQGGGEERGRDYGETLPAFRHVQLWQLLVAETWILQWGLLLGRFLLSKLKPAMPFYSIPNTRSLDQGTKKIDNCNNKKKQPEKKRPRKQGKKNSGIEKSGIRQLAEIEEAAYKIRKEGLDRCGSACDAAARAANHQTQKP